MSEVLPCETMAQAVDMDICGILAWKSALGGNQPVDVPNLRSPEKRDAYRNDHACTTSEVAGDQLLLRTSYPNMRNALMKCIKRWKNSGKRAKMQMATPI